MVLGPIKLPWTIVAGAWEYAGLLILRVSLLSPSSFLPPYPLLSSSLRDAWNKVEGLSALHAMCAYAALLSDISPNWEIAQPAQEGESKASNHSTPAMVNQSDSGLGRGGGGLGTGLSVSTMMIQAVDDR